MIMIMMMIIIMVIIIIMIMIFFFDLFFANSLSSSRSPALEGFSSFPEPSLTTG